MSLNPLGFNPNVAQNPYVTSVTSNNSVDSTKVASNSILSKVLPETNSYQNDIMMAGIDFKGMAEAINAPVVSAAQTSNNTAQTSQQLVSEKVSFSGNEKPVLKKIEEEPVITATKKEQQNSKTDNDSSIIPIVGGVFGAITPLVCNYVHTGKFLSKNLFIKMPIMAVGGICLGGILKGLNYSIQKLTNSNNDSGSESVEVQTNRMDAKA